MSAPRFVPEGFIAPVEATFGDYRLYPLGPDDTAEDCAAVNDNAQLIRQTRGGTWPSSGTLSVEEDREDLVEHQRQFAAREAFAYIIRGPASDTYAGCLYVYPPNHPFDNTDKTGMPDDADAVVSFWVTQEAYDRGLYVDLFAFVRDWMASAWPFRRVFISNQERPPEIY